MGRRKKQAKSRLKVRAKRAKSFRKVAKPYDFARRSRAAKKGWRTRRRVARLALAGIKLDRKWESIGRDGKPTGYTFERYQIDVDLDQSPEDIDVSQKAVQNAIDKVKKDHKGKPFFVGGQTDFTDAKGKKFTNNSDMVQDADPNAARKIVDSIGRTLLTNSNPFKQPGMSSDVDIEGVYVLFRFARKPARVRHAKPKPAAKTKTKVKPKRSKRKRSSK